MKSFDKIYKSKHKSVVHYINYKINDLQISQNLANDIFMKVYENLDTYDESVSSLNTWISNITKNTLIDYWRKKKLETISINEDNKDNDNENFEQYSILKHDLNPEITLIAKEFNSRFKTIIDRLPKVYVKIATMFFTDQYTYQEIAKKLDIPLGTVKGKLFRVKKLISIHIQ